MDFEVEIEWRKEDRVNQMRTGHISRWDFSHRAPLV
jgi:hypothetical protein